MWGPGVGPLKRFFLCNFIEVWLLYNVVLISDVEQKDSVIGALNRQPGVGTISVSGECLEKAIIFLEAFFGDRSRAEERGGVWDGCPPPGMSAR